MRFTILLLSTLTVLRPIPVHAACGGIVGAWTDTYGVEWIISQDGSNNLSGTMIHNGFVGSYEGACPDTFDLSGVINPSTGEFSIDVYGPPVITEDCGLFEIHYAGTVNTPGCETTSGVWIITPGTLEPQWDLTRDNGCAIPTGETTGTNAWNSTTGLTTAYDWIQTLTTSSGDIFGGRSVQEFDPGGGGPDTCWFSGSLVSQQLSITGGTWGVGMDNRWGPDTVGWLEAGVTYYRGQSRAPCQTTVPQTMKIRCDIGYVTYQSNSLTMGIGTTTVSSTRDGQFIQKSWP